MSWDYPDGCTQADHDRYFDVDYDRSLDRTDEDDEILMDCGHWEYGRLAEQTAGHDVCRSCFALLMEAEAVGTVPARIVELAAGIRARLRESERY